MVHFLLDILENMMGKGENAGFQHFPFFSTMFSKGYFPMGVKIWHCAMKG